MTAVETLELAQVSVDQLQRGILTVQDKLDQADAVAAVADRVVENISAQARKMPRRMMICAAVAFFGFAVIVIIKKRRHAQAHEEEVENLT